MAVDQGNAILVPLSEAVASAGAKSAKKKARQALKRATIEATNRRVRADAKASLAAVEGKAAKRGLALQLARAVIHAIKTRM